jgi:hypothetical protein
MIDDDDDEEMTIEDWENYCKGTIRCPTHRIHFKSGRTLDAYDCVRYEEPNQRYYLSSHIHIPFESVEYVEELKYIIG